MYPEALRNLGKLCLKEDRFKEASNYLKKTLSIDEKQPYTWYLLGMAQYFSGQNEEAIRSYETAFSMEPNLPVEAKYNLGVAYHESSRFIEAIKCYEEVLQQEPQHINALNNLGLVYSIIGERNRAIDSFEQVLELDKDNVKARINLGNVYLSNKNLDEAEKIYRSAILLDESDVSPRLNLGVVYYEKGDFEKACKEWKKLLEDDPNNVRVLSVMGSAYLERKEYKEAIEIFRKMNEIMPENGSIANTLGYLLAEQNIDLQFANNLIESAINLDKPNRAIYLDSLAWVHYKQKDYSKALKIQTKALKILKLSHEPISSVIYYHLGQIQFNLNDSVNAKKNFEAAIKSNTDDEVVKLASESLALIK